MVREAICIVIGVVLFGLCLYSFKTIDRALTSPSRPATIDCSDTEANDGCYENPECCNGGIERLKAPFYVCDPYITGDCSQEGIQMLSDQGIFITVLNDDPEYGCDDTSCECEWQDCYVAPIDDSSWGE